MPGQPSNAGTELHTGTGDVGEVMDLNLGDAKRAARVLRDQLPDADLTHSKALEIVAQQLGFRDWNTASAGLSAHGGMSAPVPVLRSLDETRAREFYIDYLHFSIEWNTAATTHNRSSTCDCAATSVSSTPPNTTATIRFCQTIP